MLHSYYHTIATHGESLGFVAMLNDVIVDIYNYQSSQIFRLCTRYVIVTINELVAD